MVERATRAKDRAANGGGGNYFLAPKTDVAFVSSGCHLLNLALGGGWCEDRIANIIGDSSTGKTLLCIEAAACFARKHEKGKIYYRETEAAFDEDYAEALGLPLDRVDFGGEPLNTVEDLYEDLLAVVDRSKQPALYILDSLDALSDRAEAGRAIDEGSYGAAKAKKLSEMFRRVVRALSKKHVTVIIVSQVRDKIGVMFGEKWSVTGGRALQFYSSQRIMLKQVKRLTSRRGKAERVVGIEVEAQIRKNKVGKPFRYAKFPIIFDYGIDSVRASIDFLKEEGGIKDPPADRKELRALAKKTWYDIEASFAPKQRKYDQEDIL